MEQDEIDRFGKMIAMSAKPTHDSEPTPKNIMADTLDAIAKEFSEVEKLRAQARRQRELLGEALNYLEGLELADRIEEELGINK